MTHLDIKPLMHRLARLKMIPLWKVIRNAARDFVQRAWEVTPQAAITKSEYYRATRYEQADEAYTDKRGKLKTRRTWAIGADGRRTKIGEAWYIHETQMAGKKPSSWKKAGIEVRKVRIKKGWSRSTWIGVMLALGMNAKNRPSRVPKIAETKSGIEVWRGGKAPSITLTDDFRINSFGRASTLPQYEHIEAEGFKLAASRMNKEVNKILKTTWRNGQ